MAAEAAAKRFKIFEVASMLGVSPPTLRLYEQLGLIRPQRTPSGTRLYGRDDLVRMQLILRLKRGGLKLQEIHDLIVLERDGQDLSGLLPRVGEILAKIYRQTVCLESLKEELVAFRRKLQAILTAD